MIREKAQELLSQLTLEEKASLCSGADFWKLKSIERLGLNQIMVTDGPHGLRKQAGESDHIGANESVKATCFPTAVTTASSWDVDLLHEMGIALGEECLQEDVAVILGPGANIKRSPLCGRNFEYISEDPFLSGKMAAGLIKGIQSKGIGTSLKHYVMNNQESRRMTIDAVVDERAQRELYLTSFEIAVKEAQPWTVMCSYNRVDGSYLSDHKRLLKDILKEEWGHTGIVVTDWGACNNRVKGIKAGMELEMPSSNGKNDEKIVNAVKEGRLSIKDLDRAVVRIVELILKSQKAQDTDFTYDVAKHHALARKIAGQSAVLLKNSGDLPLTESMSISVIGEFAKKPRFQGAGSSIINPHQLDNVCDILSDKGINYKYAAGYHVKSSDADEKLMAEAVELAKESQVVLLMAGLTDDYESEGFDRTHMRLPESHNELIQRVAQVNDHVVVLLQNGSPVEMPWINQVAGVLECYLGGQAGAGGVVDVLYGEVNPSGKLAETFPVKLEDNSSYEYFPGDLKTVEYRESIYVGYRYYDKAKKQVLFPFGYGLSYTSFEYANLKVKDKHDFDYEVSLSIKNTGDLAGAEVVQLYIKNNDSPIFKADKELKAFKKVWLEPGQSKTVTMTLNYRSFAYYNTNISDWHVDGGRYSICLASSSADIRLEKVIDIEVNDGVLVPDYKKLAPAYYNLPSEDFKIEEDQFRALYGRKLPRRHALKGEIFTRSSSMLEVKEKWIGKILYNVMLKNAKKMLGSDDETPGLMNEAMIESLISEMPIRTLGMLGGDRLPKFFAEALVEILNGRWVKGFRLMLKK